MSVTALAGKRILLIVGGGIAAYKALETARRLQDHGAKVRAVVTAAGQQFVTPLSLGAITGDKVYTDLFSLTDEADMGHIELSRDADLLVVAPATADLMAKMANGLANDLASTLLLATDKPVLIVPAMNVRMWDHAATRRNLDTLRGDGVLVVGPNEGGMACGEFGFGRMAEPAEIVAAVIAAVRPTGQVSLPPPGVLSGRHVLVTSGPTREAIDPVRYISNHSSGKQGHAIAQAAAAAGARVTLVSGPVALPDPAGVTTIHVDSAREMLAAVEAALPADLAVFAAAVADWRVAEVATAKLKKGASGAPRLHFVENPDILATVASRTTGRPSLVVGFAAETERVVEQARAKLDRKRCDLIVANDVAAGTDTFGGDANTVHLVSRGEVIHWPRQSKGAVAQALVAHCAALLGTKP